MILILTQCFPPKLGGIETLMGGLAGALAASGRSVTVLADGADDAGWDAAANYAVRRFSGLKPLRRALKAWAARQILRGAEHPIVIADSWKSLQAPLGGLAKAAAPGRVLCLAHGMEFPAAPSDAKIRRMRASFDGAHVLANSRDTAARAAAYASSGAPPLVVRPPIDRQPDAAPGAVAALEARIGLASDAPLIAGLARLEPRKGFDRLIEAFRLRLAAHPTARLAIAGGGPDRERLEASARTLGLDGRVVFLGRVSDAEKAALLTRADVFAMPARVEGDSVEGFGLVYLEAAWYGAPALAGRAGGASDAVLDGVTGLLCDGEDAAAVAMTLERLLSDGALRRRLGDNAAARAREWVWEKRVGEYLAPLTTG